MELVAIFASAIHDSSEYTYFTVKYASCFLRRSDPLRFISRLLSMLFASWNIRDIDLPLADRTRRVPRSDESFIRIEEED